jgi:hypothetical protein
VSVLPNLGVFSQRLVLVWSQLRAYRIEVLLHCHPVHGACLRNRDLLEIDVENLSSSRPGDRSVSPSE